MNHITVVESTYNLYFLADAFGSRNRKFNIADPSTVSQATLKLYRSRLGCSENH